jgi:hypothetical protein
MKDLIHGESRAGLVSVAKLAQLLDCSPKTIRDWMYKNRLTPSTDPLPFYKIGGLIRFNMNEVIAWVLRHRVRVGAASVLPPLRTPDGRGERSQSL